MKRELIARVIRFVLLCRWLLVVPPARVIGWLRPARQIVDVWPKGAITLGPKIVLFMHFDRRGNIRPQLLDYMRELKEAGRSVVLVSNARRLKPAAMAAAQAHCVALIVRRNVGYDFGAWRDAIDFLKLPREETEEVILANDSVFGPLLPLADTLRRINYTKADVWGLTDSWQVRYHLQSFFIAFGSVALRSEAFAKFWRSVRPVPAKTYVIDAYEVGVTQAMIKGGLSCAAIWRYETLIKMVNREELERLLGEEQSEAGKADPVQSARKKQALRIRDRVGRRVALNPTADLWRQLLQSGFPFIKRELLRDNPGRVEDVGDWVDVVREELAADPEPILLDLRTMLKGGAP
jgi:hypothetical protein